MLAITDSVLFLARTGRYAVGKYDHNGRLLASICVDRARKHVSQQVVKAYRTRAMRNATDAYTTREWTTLSADDVFPQELPAFDQMLVDSSGRLWVRESATELDRSALWVVLNADGHPLARLRLPAPLSVTAVNGDRILGVWNDFDAPEQVRVYRLVSSGNQYVAASSRSQSGVATHIPAEVRNSNDSATRTRHRAHLLPDRMP